MSCGIVDEESVRSIAAIREDVPWHNQENVKVEWKRHGNRHYYVILHYALGRDLPPVVHSAWRTKAAVSTYLRVNPGAEQEPATV
ncbi:MAG: hypothetical protein WEE64_12020 [Dehalococcoidia bacterium]